MTSEPDWMNVCVGVAKQSTTTTTTTTAAAASDQQLQDFRSVILVELISFLDVDPGLRGPGLRGPGLRGPGLRGPRSTWTRSTWTRSTWTRTEKHRGRDFRFLYFFLLLIAKELKPSINVFNHSQPFQKHRQKRGGT